jgi:hypothetical protein
MNGSGCPWDDRCSAAVGEQRPQVWMEQGRLLWMMPPLG